MQERLLTPRNWPVVVSVEVAWCYAAPKNPEQMLREVKEQVPVTLNPCSGVAAGRKTMEGRDAMPMHEAEDTVHGRRGGEVSQEGVVLQAEGIPQEEVTRNVGGDNDLGGYGWD